MSRERTLRGSNTGFEDEKRRDDLAADAGNGDVEGKRDQRRPSWRQSMQKDKGWEDEDPFGDEAEEGDVKYKTLAWW